MGNSHKKALVTGITGQDGSYLIEYLLSKGYEVHGLRRPTSVPNTARLASVQKDIHKKDVNCYLHYADLQDSSSLLGLCYDVQPDEVYNLGAQSHVRVSFDVPEQTGDITGLSTVRLLEAIRRIKPDARFYQASSSEMFGAATPPQNEDTVFHPRSPYAVAKVYSYWITVNYRESYNMYACNGILFNHESPRRGESFVTRKITKTLARIFKGEFNKIFLGNLDAKRDWGFAPEYVEAMHLMLQQDNPDDYVVGTGDSRSVREFLEVAFSYAGIDIEWQGSDVNEKGIIANISGNYNQNSSLKVGDTIVEIDPYYFRPAEVDYLLADISKAKKVLNWEPRITFDDLVKIMVDFDLKMHGLDRPGAGEEVLKTKSFSWTKNDSSLIHV